MNTHYLPYQLQVSIIWKLLLHNCEGRVLWVVAGRFKVCSTGSFACVYEVTEGDITDLEVILLRLSLKSMWY